MLLIAINIFQSAAAAIRRAIADFGFTGNLLTAAALRSPAASYSGEPRRLTLAEQWTRLADIIRCALKSAEEAAQCHASAALQLDLAQYGLISLVDELSAVMDMGGRRRRATVHVLEFPAPHAIGEAIAA